MKKSSFAGLPSTEICLTCHSQLYKDAPELAPLHESARTDKPVEWSRVHDLPDFIYFDHCIHVNKGAACLECHGRIDQMSLTHRVASLEMQWCLSCHRNMYLHLHLHLHLRQANATIRIYVSIGLFTLALLFLISGSDYLTRVIHDAAWFAPPASASPAARIEGLAPKPPPGKTARRAGNNIRKRRAAWKEGSLSSVERRRALVAPQRLNSLNMAGE